jgi:lipopolysaccharide export system permease protein
MNRKKFFLGTLWQRYIFFGLVQNFFFFLLCFFLLYSLIDFSTHAHDFLLNGKLNCTKLSSYYLYQLIKRLPLLLPLALLIATIRSLTLLNANRELLALQASGVPLKKIFRPFFLLVLLCSILGYCNEEVLSPKSVSYFEQARQLEGKTPFKKIKRKQFALLQLEDSSQLIYQRFDEEKNAFFDVYWIRSFHDIWRMKYLHVNPKAPIGEYVDHIVRSKEGFLEKAESYEKCLLPSLKWETSTFHKKQSSIKHQKISQLAYLFLKKDKHSFHAQGEIKTHFFHKLLMPLLPLLVFLSVAPFCVSYSRNIPIFIIYAVSIFGFILFFTFTNALVILGENQVLPPFVVMLSPFLLSFGLAGKKFYRLS